MLSGVVAVGSSTARSSRLLSLCVGVSGVPKVQIRPETAVMDLLFSGFLALPTEALADLTAEIVLCE